MHYALYIYTATHPHMCIHYQTCPLVSGVKAAVTCYQCGGFEHPVCNATAGDADPTVTCAQMCVVGHVPLAFVVY